MEKHKKEKKKLGLSTKIFIALLTGAVCGVLIHYYMPEGYFRDTILINGILYVLGNGFIRLMQMLVVPLYSAPWSAAQWPSVIRKRWELWV